MIFRGAYSLLQSEPSRKTGLEFPKGEKQDYQIQQPMDQLIGYTADDGYSSWFLEAAAAIQSIRVVGSRRCSQLLSYHD
jgi:hypothetical protein